MLVGGMIRFIVFNARNGKHFMALIKGCWDDMAYGVWHLYLGAVTEISIKMILVILSLLRYFACPVTMLEALIFTAKWRTQNGSI